MNKPFRPAIVLLGVCLLFMICVGQADAQEWTRFHGPNGTGVSETKLPAQWTDIQLNWKVELPGVGHSSPVLWGNKIFLLSADPKNATRYLICHNADNGRRLWMKTFPSTPHHLHLRSSFASCTPAVDADRVYVGWSTPAKTSLMAFDHSGKLIWGNDLGTWQSQHGFGTSPILYKNMVILSNSQQANQLKEGEKPGESFMMAFDRETGEELWRTERKSMNVCYSVPFIYTPKGGEPELISISTGNGMYSLAPETGKENWTIDIFTKRTVGSPILAGGLIIGTTGSGGGGNYVVAVRPGKTPEIVYEIKKSAPYVPTSVTRGNLVFLWYDKGIVTCIDAPTGNIHWQKRIGGNFSGSPVRAGDKIYCIDEAGVVVTLAAEKEFKELGRTPLGEASRSTPAIARGQIFFRTYSHLIAAGNGSL